MAPVWKLTTLTLIATVATGAQAGYTTSQYILPSSTISEYCVSLSKDGTCGAFASDTGTARASGSPYPMPLPSSPITIYAFRPDFNGGAPVAISGSLQHCSAPRMSSDGRCVVFWAERNAGGNLVADPYIVVFPPVSNPTWSAPIAVAAPSTTLSFLSAGAPTSIAVTDYPDTSHPPTIVFRDPAAHAPPPEGVAYQKLIKWNLGSPNVFTYVPTPDRNCDTPWINSRPDTDPLGMVITYVGTTATSTEIYRFTYLPSGGYTDTCISLNAAGTPANGNCLYPQVSGDSRFVVFQSLASNLDGANPCSFMNVFILDTQTSVDHPYGVVTRAYDFANASNPMVGGDVIWPTISFDGNWVSYQSAARGLMPSLSYPKSWSAGVYLIPRTNRSSIEMVSLGLDGSVKNGYRPSVANNAVIGFDSDSKGIATGDTTSPEHSYVKSGHF